MSGLLEINADNYQEEIFESDIPVLADFSAEWCGPCKRLGPIVEEIAEEMKSKVKVVHIDIDVNQDLASNYNVLSIPTLILFKGGEEVERTIGLVSKTHLVDFINSNI
ncbi:thioredoxin [bacterium]|nr:thioredoxin [bacterium]